MNSLMSGYNKRYLCLFCAIKKNMYWKHYIKLYVETYFVKQTARKYVYNKCIISKS